MPPQWQIAALVQRLAGGLGVVGTEWRFYMDPFRRGDRVNCDAVPWLSFAVDDLFAGIVE